MAAIATEARTPFRVKVRDGGESLAVAGLRIDEVGAWSEIKLEIVRRYATEYSKILSKQKEIRRYSYIDGFAGAGRHFSKATGKVIPGSPAIALNVAPPFSEYHLIDLDGNRVAELKALAAGHSNVKVYNGDCNKILLEEVFPRCLFEDFSRGLCLLDPYGLNVNWEVLAKAGSMKTVEVFYNFMIMDANMNVFFADPDKIRPDQASRMDSVWGDDTWRAAAYSKSQRGLFDDRVPKKRPNDAIAQAFRAQLRERAGFAYVPDPVPMRNRQGAIIYYLFFASPNRTGGRIVADIFKKHGQ